jgi:hypothetical protein
MTLQSAPSREIAPASGGGQARLGLLVYGLLIPPFVWALELYLNFGLASHACFPDRTPRASFLPGWESIWVGLLVINIVCVAACAAGLIASGFSWRRLRVVHPVPAEEGGVPHPAEGRLSAFAVSGLLVSGLFALAVLFNTLSLWALSTCSQA